MIFIIAILLMILQANGVYVPLPCWILYCVFAAVKALSALLHFAATYRNGGKE